MKACLALGLLTPWLLSTAAAADCAATAAARRAVDDYYRAIALPDRTLQSELDGLFKDPNGALCLLVKDLRPISATRLSPAQQSQRSARPIWAIRALRYLTGCQEFRGNMKPTGAMRKGDTRWEFLLREGESAVPFFATWMSRDVVFVAPLSVQTEVIAAWRTWRQRNANSYEYRACTGTDRWYM